MYRAKRQCRADHLRRFAVDALKIDISFVQEIRTSDRDRVLVTAMTAMARALGVRTVAEGVEAAEQLALLAEIGVDDAQGWHLGRPAPAEAAAAFLPPARDPSRTLRPRTSGTPPLRAAF